VGDFVKSDIYMNTFGHAVAEMVRIFLRIEAIEVTRYKILPQKSSKKIILDTQSPTDPWTRNIYFFKYDLISLNSFDYKTIEHHVSKITHPLS